MIRFLLVAMSLAPQAIAQTAGTAFTYQGRLAESGAPANGPYDFQMVLYTAAVGGSQVGPVVILDDVAVAGGLFTVNLDFGPGAFPGDARYLEIGVRPGASGGPYTLLGTRQELKPAPHSVFSQEAPWTGVGGKPPGFADDVDNDVLGGLACASGQVAKWNGATWACAADTDTTYSAGAGLDLAGTTFSVADLGVTTAKLANDAVNSAKVADASIATADLADNAVTSAKIADGTIALADLGPNGCVANQVMKWNGTAWACAVDTDTTYSAGAGLTLSGTTFSVADLGITTAKLADSAVTSAKVADLSIATADLANSAVTSAKIADATIALADLGQNGCGTSQILKWNGAAWACANDADTNSGGTVTSVGTGAGLTGGPITTTGTVSVATGGITSSLIANGAVGLAQINTAQVQARVGGTCPVGQYLRGINADGTVLCALVLATNVVAIVEDTADALSDNAIAIGADGLPVISYQDVSLGALKVAHCGNAACTSGNTLTVVDNPANIVGTTSAIAIGTDGLPVISYFDQTAFALKVTHCGNAACTAGNTVTTVDDPADQVGIWTSIAIGADGLPVISYYDPTAFALKVAHCGNAACTAGNTLVTVDNPANDVGAYTSIAIGIDGLPVISYLDNTADALKVAHCGNVTCTAGNTLTTVDDPANLVGYWTSIAVGTDGLPVVSYFDATANALKVAHCGNAACSAGNSLATVDDPANLVGNGTSIAVGTDGLPIVSYNDATAAALKVAHCGNATCTTGNTPVVVDDHPVNSLGYTSSIAIGTDGLPVISYNDSTANSLKVLKCATRTCQ